MTMIRTPDAPATQKQLWYLHTLTGEDTTDWNITMQQASDKIDELTTKKNVVAQPVIEDETPFTEAHVTIVQGDQRSGKTCYAVAKIKDGYDNDCVRIFCRDQLGMTVDSLSYDRQSRIAKIKIGKAKKLIRIPEWYVMKSPMRIFSNISLFGIPYYKVKSFVELLALLRNGFISKGTLLVDEAHKGMSARGSMTSLGRELVGEYFQFGKSHLDVYIVTHNPRLIDWTARTVPTRSVHTLYDSTTQKIEFSLRERGDRLTKTYYLFAPAYWPYYNTDEKVLQ